MAPNHGAGATYCHAGPIPEKNLAGQTPVKTTEQTVDQAQADVQKAYEKPDQGDLFRGVQEADVLDEFGNYDIVKARQKGYHTKKLEKDLEQLSFDFGRPSTEPVDSGGSQGDQVSTGRGRMGGVTTFGVSVPRKLLRNGYVDLRGHKVETHRDVAAIAQVFRDPRIETLRIIYLKGDTIVGHEGWSNRMPGFVHFFSPKEESKQLEKMVRRMMRLNADGFYLLHNHPSGEPTPSPADISLTMFIRDQFTAVPQLYKT